MKKLNLATVNKSEVNVGSVVNTNISGDGDFLIKVARFLIDYFDHFLVDVSWILPFICYVKDAHFDDNILYVTNYNGEEYYLNGDVDYDYDEDEDDSEDDSFISDSRLWCNMWQNTGMKDQPIYEYYTHSPNGVLGDAVGTIRVTIPNLKDVDFLIDKDYVEEDGYGIIHVRNLSNGEYYGHYEIHTNDDELRSPWYEVTDTICDIQNHGRGAIYSDSEEVINCIKDISDKLNLGYVFEERYCHEEMSDYTAVFSKDLAEKLYLGKTVQFAYKVDVAKSIVEESENGRCDYELRDVAIEEPDGYISHEKAYVIFFDNEEERQMNA